MPPQRKNKSTRTVIEITVVDVKDGDPEWTVVIKPYGEARRAVQMTEELPFFREEFGEVLDNIITAAPEIPSWFHPKE